ncbi:MAG: hypothetical protein ACOCQD_00660 [archaeon]
MGHRYEITYLISYNSKLKDIDTICAGNLREALYLFERKNIGKEVIKIKKVNENE